MCSTYILIKRSEEMKRVILWLTLVPINVEYYILARSRVQQDSTQLQKEELSGSVLFDMQGARRIYSHKRHIWSTPWFTFEDIGRL